VVYLVVVARKLDPVVPLPPPTMPTVRLLVAAIWEFFAVRAVPLDHAFPA